MKYLMVPIVLSFLISGCSVHAGGQILDNTSVQFSAFADTASPKLGANGQVCVVGHCLGNVTEAE